MVRLEGWLQVLDALPIAVYQVGREVFPINLRASALGANGAADIQALLREAHARCGATPMALCRGERWHAYAARVPWDPELAIVALAPCCGEGSYRPGALARAFDLSEREGAVLALVTRGHTNHEIAQALALSENTVKTHLRHIYRRMGTHGREDTALRVRAEEARCVPLEGAAGPLAAAGHEGSTIRDLSLPDHSPATGERPPSPGEGESPRPDRKGAWP
jgi:DNA-binding CsgD family transcriptional regulator